MHRHPHARPHVLLDPHMRTEMAGLAQRTIASSGGAAELGDISWASFPDQFPNIHVKVGALPVML